MGELGLRRFLFCVDRITLQPLEAAPAEKLSTRLRIFPPCDLWRLGEYLSPAALPEKGFFEAPNAVVVQKGDTELLPIKFDIQFVTDIQTLIEPLLSETWVQGKAPVWANMYDVSNSSSACEEVQVAMLGIRISLEDVTAASGLLPDGAAPPPALAITQPDAQIPPPPPKVPSILPMHPQSGSHSPQLSLSPTNTHGSQSEANLPRPPDGQDMQTQAQSPQAHQRVDGDSINALFLDGGLDSQLAGSEDSADVDAFLTSGLGSPILTAEQVDLAPRPGLPLTPCGTSIEALQASNPTPSPSVPPSPPQSSMHIFGDRSESEAAAKSNTHPQSNRKCTSPSGVCSKRDAAARSSTHALSNPLCTSPGSAPPTEDSRDDQSDAVSSPVHFLAEAACTSPLSASPEAEEHQAAAAARTASPSPSILDTTQSVTSQPQQPSLIPRPQLMHSSTSLSASSAPHQPALTAPSQDGCSTSAASLQVDVPALQSPEQAHCAAPSAEHRSMPERPPAVHTQQRTTSPAPSEHPVRSDQQALDSLQGAAGAPSHTRTHDVRRPSHSAHDDRPSQHQEAPLPSLSANATDHQNLPETFGGFAMRSSEPGAHACAPDLAIGLGDSTHSEYRHPASVPENAHMRPDIAHAHLRPPVPAHRDSQLLHGITAQPQPAAPVSNQQRAPTAPSHHVATAPVSKEHPLDPSPPPPAHNSSPSAAGAHQQAQRHPHEWDGELPHATETVMATPSMHGWPQVHSSGSIARSLESHAELVHARAAAAERAAESEARARQVAAFEAWRRRELLTWRRDVVQSETEQMAALEAAWAEREVTRQRDIADAVARVETLRAQLLQKAEELEEREARLLASEEATLRHKDDLEATGAARAHEAQAAIARLQAEFSHQLAVEAARGSELSIQRTTAQQELESAQADAKRKRAQLAAAQAETPQVAVEALHVEIAAARRRAADAERSRCETEAISAQYTQRLEVLARQLEEARGMQRRAREAAERATLATPPPASQPVDVAPNTTSPEPPPPPPTYAPATQPASLSGVAAAADSVHHPPPQQPPERDYSTSVHLTAFVEQACAVRQRAGSVSPVGNPADGVATAALSSDAMQPIVIPPPPMPSGSTHATSPAQHAHTTAPAAPKAHAVVSGTKPPTSSSEHPPPALISTPKAHLRGQDGDSTQQHSSSGPRYIAEEDPSLSGRAQAPTAGNLKQPVASVQRENKKAPRAHDSTAGDTVLAHRHGMENQAVQRVAPEDSDSGKDMLTEIKRLFHERSKLLATGCYSMNDMVIARISERISSLSGGL